MPHGSCCLLVRYCAETCSFHFTANANVKHTCMQSCLAVRWSKMDTLNFLKILAGEVFREINMNHTFFITEWTFQVSMLQKLMTYVKEVFLEFCHHFIEFDHENLQGFCTCSLEVSFKKIVSPCLNWNINKHSVEGRYMYCNVATSLQRNIC